MVVLSLNMFFIKEAYKPSPILIFQVIWTKTRPSSDSEAATIYKLKEKSLNMRTGQDFKSKELVRPAGL